MWTRLVILCGMNWKKCGMNRKEADFCSVMCTMNCCNAWNYGILWGCCSCLACDMAVLSDNNTLCNCALKGPGQITVVCLALFLDRVQT